MSITQVTITQGIEDLAALEDAFGIPRRYIDNLKNEDDWSLIIKSHALLESACADMLCHYFGKQELADVFAQLEMSNKRYGKAAFISALKLLSQKERRFISALSELRNLVVHNASNVTFSLHGYLLSLPNQKRIDFKKSLDIRLENITVSDKVIEGDEPILNHPGIVIWSSLTLCLGSIYIQDVFAIKRNQFVAEKVEEQKRKGPIHITSESLPLSVRTRRTR